MKIVDLLTDSSTWTQFTAARDIENNPVDYQSDQACKFCLIGACMKIYPATSERFRIYDLIANELKKRSIPGMRICSNALIMSWNDSSSCTFNEVKELITKLNI